MQFIPPSQSKFIINPPLPPPSQRSDRQSFTNPFDVRGSGNMGECPMKQTTTVANDHLNTTPQFEPEKAKAKEVRVERFDQQKKAAVPLERKTEFTQARESIKKVFGNPPPTFSPEKSVAAFGAPPTIQQSEMEVVERLPTVSFDPFRKSVLLLKGHHLSLSQQVPRLKSIMIGLGWDFSRKHNKVFDLDASVFLLQENGKVREARDFIYYNNLQSSCGSVIHNGDNRTGIGDSDNETIMVNLTTLPSEISKLIFVVSIHEAEKRKQNFGMVEHSFIRVVDLETNMEICRYDLKHDVGKFYAMIFGEVYQCVNEWRFRAIGQGFDGGLKSMAEFFGVKLVDRDAQGKHHFFRS